MEELPTAYLRWSSRCRTCDLVVLALMLQLWQRYLHLHLHLLVCQVLTQATLGQIRASQLLARGHLPRRRTSRTKMLMSHSPCDHPYRMPSKRSSSCSLPFLCCQLVYRAFQSPNRMWPLILVRGLIWLTKRPMRQQPHRCTISRRKARVKALQLQPG